ncbi:MAG: tetratricopeptide repeat protein, partial [Candidatus Eremiobacterota bacterium]
MKHLAVIFVIILSFFLCTGWTWFNPFKSKAQEGNELYKAGRYDEALKKYTDAQVEDPNAVSLYYNMGNALYQKKEYDKSIELYKKSSDNADKDLMENSLYNTGNSCFRMNKFEEAIKYYINALKLNPDDMDAKYNLEMARKKMKENQDKQNQDKQNQDKQNQDKQNQDKQNQDKQNQDKQNQDK